MNQETFPTCPECGGRMIKNGHILRGNRKERQKVQLYRCSLIPCSRQSTKPVWVNRDGGTSAAGFPPEAQGR